MKKTIVISIQAVLLLMTMVTPGVAAVRANASQVAVRENDKTLERVLDGMAAALGGRKRIAEVRNIASRYEFEVAGFKGTAEDLMSTDGRTYTNATLKGLGEQKTALAGGRAWIRDLNGNVRDQGPAEVAQAVTQVYLATYSYLNPAGIPGKVHYAGTDEKSGAHVLELQPEGGQVATLLVDPASFLPVSVSVKLDDRTQSITYGDWREVEGIRVAFTFSQSTGDPRTDTKVTVQEVRVNVPVDETAFAKPKVQVVDYEFASGSSSIGIPFEMTSNHIYVQTSLNGSKPLWFLLDTGAGASVINMNKAKELGLPMQGNLRARGAGEGTVEASFVPGISYGVQGVEVKNQRLVAIPLDALVPFEGRAMDGILGYDFISRFVVEIDYAAKRLNLYDPKVWSYSGSGDRLPIRLEGNIPQVQARIEHPGHEPLEGWYTVDTGARSALTLNSPVVQETWLKAVADGAKRAPHGLGVGGEAKATVGRLGALHLGRFALEQPVVGFSYDQKGAFASTTDSGNIGGEVLRRFKVVFDYSRKEMILEKNEIFDEPFEYDMFGAWLGLDQERPGALKVLKLVDASPAVEIGLREGDRILAVDGTPVASLDLEDVRRRFRHAHGKEVRLRIESEGKVREATVTLRRML